MSTPETATAERPAPPDQAARDRILTSLDETLFVEAGAGSGKTTQLVGRVVSLVAAGTELGAIAAITFTEAAASELRHRIREDLEEAARDEGRSALERERCARGANDVDHAAISTLHAFAQRILAEHPLEAGLPPAIDVLDEIQSALAAGRRWEAFLDALYDDEANEPLLMRQHVLKIKDDRLRHLSKVFGDNYDRLDDVVWPEVRLESIDVRALLGLLSLALDQRRHCTSADDKLLAHLDGPVIHFAQLLVQCQSDDDRLEVLTSGAKLKARIGQKANWDACDVETVRGLLAEAQAMREAIADQAIADCLAQLARKVAAFTLTAADERRREGRLEFHDLLVLARRLLRTDAATRRVLHDRYRCLLLDEFQDTDPLQIELAVLVAADRDAPIDRPWFEIPVEPGRLFFVGDPKQSIYRFRRADVALFMEAERHFAPEPTVLAANFRSSPEVIQFVNGLFAELITEETDESGGMAQPSYQPLSAARDEPVRPGGDHGPSVWLCGGPTEGLKAGELRELEARSVAAAARRVLDEGLLVLDAEEGWRPARPDDIAVLLPGRTSLPQLEDALIEAGLPYRLETGSLVWGSQEVRELLAILRAIDDPSDEIALVTALRSPAFGCGDDDLVRYHQGGGKWNLHWGWRRPDQTASSGGVLPLEGMEEADERPVGVRDTDPVPAALAALRHFHDQRWWTDVAGMVETIVRERHLFAFALADRRPRDAWRRLRYVVDQARAFTESGGGTLREFLAWSELLSSDTTGVPAKVLPEPDDRALRVLTIHGSKGLEFPVTIVTGLTTRLGGARPGVRVAWSREGAPPQVRLSKGRQTDAFEASLAVDEQLDQHERTRLLYVALTRARDHLFVATHHDRKAECFARAVWTWADAHPEVWTDAEAFPSSPPSTAPSPDWVRNRPEDDAMSHPDAHWARKRGGEDAVSRPDGGGVDREGWIDRRADLLAAQPPSALAATAIARAVHDAQAAELALVADEADEADEGVDATRPPWAKGRGGTAFGRAVHASLQTVDLASGHDIAATARAQAAAEGVSDRADAVEHRVRAALEAPIVQMAAAGPHWRELYVAAPLGDTLIEGFVDLLVRTPEGLVVVDYKTDAVSGPAQIDAAVARYRLQGATYALALERHLGEPVARCVFLFLTSSGPVEREVDDLRRAIGTVASIVERSATPGVPQP